MTIHDDLVAIPLLILRRRPPELGMTVALIWGDHQGCAKLSETSCKRNMICPGSGGGSGSGVTICRRARDVPLPLVPLPTASLPSVRSCLDCQLKSDILINSSINLFKMSSIIGRSAFRATRPLTFRAGQPLRYAAASDKEAGREALKSGAKRDPELIVRSNSVQITKGKRSLSFVNRTDSFHHHDGCFCPSRLAFL